MAKTLTIKIKSVGETLEGFRETFKAYEAGRRVSRREGVYFTSIEAAPYPSAARSQSQE